jgi:DNA-directed RNA polymerase, mitochondrial
MMMDRENEARSEAKTDDGPEELARATEKFERRQERIAKSEGFGATELARAITRRWIPEFAVGLKRVLSDRKTQSPVHREFLAVVRDLDREVLALCILQGVLHSMGQGKSSYRDAALRVGRDIAAECWAAELTTRDSKLSARIGKRVKQRFSSSKARLDAARAMAARAGYKTREWDNELRLHAGNWALTVLLDLLPDVFILTKEGQERLLTITEGAQAYADGIVDEVISRNPVWLPRPEAPLPWTGWDQGGTNDKRLQSSLTLVRSKYKQKTATVIRSAIRDGSMGPTLDALNALQAVPWTINKPVLDVIRESADRGLEVPGLPRQELITQVRDLWNDETNDQRALRKLVHQALGARVLFREDIRTAERMCRHERFYTAMNLEWRGRVYCVPSFNFQREDRIRALFLFAKGEPIGEEGIFWLKVHVANCGDFDRIKKQPFRDRVKWVDDNLELIRSTAESPVPMFKKWVEQTAKHPEHKWQGPDKPFLFLGSCRAGVGFACRAFLCDTASSELRWIVFGLTASMRHDASARGFFGKPNAAGSTG